MMRGFLKALLSMLLSFMLGAVVSFVVFEGIINSYKLSTHDEISASDNITYNVGSSERLAILKSRESAVQIMSAAEHSPVVSSSSGTYFRHDNKHYVLTVAHSIIGPCSTLRILTDSDMHECKELVVINRIVDYAIIKVDKIKERKPIKIKRSKPKNSRWDQALSIQSNVYYTGYPNGLGPLTINGKIVGHDKSENLYVHTFAWPGSSGSGVFNERGQFIGYVMAISVGITEFGITVLEDMTIVVPLYQVDWSVLNGEEDTQYEF